MQCVEASVACLSVPLSQKKSAIRSCRIWQPGFQKGQRTAPTAPTRTGRCRDSAPPGKWMTSGGKRPEGPGPPGERPEGHKSACRSPQSARLHHPPGVRASQVPRAPQRTSAHQAQSQEQRPGEEQSARAAQAFSPFCSCRPSVHGHDFGRRSPSLIPATLDHFLMLQGSSASVVS
jgi:hypothetical protein